jgi:hypothetical protein
MRILGLLHGRIRRQGALVDLIEVGGASRSKRSGTPQANDQATIHAEPIQSAACEAV